MQGLIIALGALSLGQYLLLVVGLVITYWLSKTLISKLIVSVRGWIDEFVGRAISMFLTMVWGADVEDIDPVVVAWFTRYIVGFVAILGAVAGLKFLLGTLVFSFRVWQLITADKPLEKEAAVSGEDEPEKEKQDEPSVVSKWMPFVKITAIYIGLVAASASSVYTVWRNLRGILRLFEVTIPAWVADLVESCFPSFAVGSWDSTETWNSQDSVTLPHSSATVTSQRWDAAAKAYEYFARHPDTKTYCISFSHGGKFTVMPSTLGLGYAPGSCVAKLSDQVPESRCCYRLEKHDVEGDEKVVYYSTLSFTFVRDDSVVYTVSKLGWLNAKAVYLAVSVVLVAAVFYYYYCFYHVGAFRSIKAEARTKVNRSQWKKKQHEIASPSDSGTDDEGSGKTKPDWVLPDEHPMMRESQKKQTKEASDEVSGKKKKSLKTEALHSAVTSKGALDKVKKIKPEAAVASSPTVPGRVANMCCLVEINEKGSNIIKTITGFAAMIKGAGQLEVPPVQVIVCPASHGIVADHTRFEFNAIVNTAEGSRRVPVAYYTQWTYQVGKESETGTAFLYNGGGLKMFKAPLTNELHVGSTNQGLIYSALSRSVSGGSVRLEKEGFVIHEIATQPGDSGAIVWSTVLNEARTAVTVPVAIHIGQNGSNVAVPVGVALKAVNFQ